MSALVEAAIRRTRQMIQNETADWRQAVVTTVRTNGTVDVTLDGDTVPSVRRGPAYPAPAVGDSIVIHRNSVGNWYAEGRLASGTPGPWITPASGDYGTNIVAAGITNYQDPRYRKDPTTGVVYIEGLVKTTGTTTVTDAATLLTLPTGYCPAAVLVSASLTSAGPSGSPVITARQLEINTAGQIRLTHLGATALTIVYASITCSFSTT